MLYLFSRAERVVYSIKSRLSRKDRYMGRDTSGRLKSAYSATEISYNIEKKSCCKLCCLCFVSLPHGAVGFSGVCHRGIF